VEGPLTADPPHHIPPHRTVPHLTQLKRWKHLIRDQDRDLAKSLRGMEAEEVKSRRLLLSAAARGDAGSARVLARQIAAARRHASRLGVARAQLNSLLLQLQQQAALLRVTGVLKESGEMMRMVNAMVRVPEVAATMAALSGEMMKAGILEEMVGETLDAHLHEEGVEEEADAEVDRVLYELTKGMLGEAPAAGKAKVGMPVCVCVLCFLLFAHGAGN
jgi:charged multivesicular body protein 3